MISVSEHFGTENYLWKFGIIQKSLWILPMFLVWFFEPRISWDLLNDNRLGRRKTSICTQFIYNLSFLKKKETKGVNMHAKNIWIFPKQKKTKNVSVLANDIEIFFKRLIFLKPFVEVQRLFFFLISVFVLAWKRLFSS